jgi:SAM-dependent methyltransferase
MAAPPLLFDRALRRRRLDRAAAGFETADFLHRRAALDIAERIAPILRDFPLAVDLSARRGALREALAETAPGRVGLLIEAEVSARMLAGRTGPRLVADDERLPFADQSLDLIVSPLALHWANDVVGALIQAHRALKPGGLFLGAILGGVTLTELRQAITQAEIEVLGGTGSRVSPFADAQDAANLLQRAGFDQPVTDIDSVSVTYAHPLKLLADLRAMGETSLLADRHPKPLTRSLLARICEIYFERFSAPNGRVTATFEILTLTGWAAERAFDSR